MVWVQRAEFDSEDEQCVPFASDRFLPAVLLTRYPFRMILGFGSWPVPVCGSTL